mgnify:CR=1 FL=1
MHKLLCRNLWKIFGKAPEKALAALTANAHSGDKLAYPDHVAAVRDVGLTPVGELFHRFNAPDDRQSGITGVVLLAESHLAVHTWPEIGGVTIDAYVCNFGADNTARAEALMARLVAAFAPMRVQQQRLCRGLPA